LMLSRVSIELTAARALLLMTQNVNVSRSYAANEDVEQIDYKQTNKALRLASIAEREMLSRGPE
jgi:outer membrane lipopolysaccharide assembly protein LptE/RlpB